MRAFLAIEIDDETKTVLSGMINKLASAGSGISWVKPAQMHLTLWFFEDLREEMLEKVISAVGTAVRGVPPFRLEIKKTGTFGAGGHPRVFWCGVGGDIAALTALYTKIETSFKEIGIKGDDKPFRPHLTIGRNKSGSKQERVAVLLRGLRDYQVGGFTAGGITLFRSELQREGAVHTPVRHFPLEGAP